MTIHVKRVKRGITTRYGSDAPLIPGEVADAISGALDGSELLLEGMSFTPADGNGMEADITATFTVDPASIGIRAVEAAAFPEIRRGGADNL